MVDTSTETAIQVTRYRYHHCDKHDGSIYSQYHLTCRLALLISSHIELSPNDSLVLLFTVINPTLIDKIHEM